VAASDTDWDLLRVFLALMRADTLREAAAALGTSHPTVHRKLNALETQLGVMLFERAQQGLRATPEAVELLALAESVEANFDALARRASGLSTQIAGEIRVTVPDLIASLLIEDFAAFTNRWPRIQLRIEPTYDVMNLRRGEADVAIRVMPHGESPSDELVGRKAGTIYAATYGQTHQWIRWWGDQRDDAFINDTPFSDRRTAIVLPDVHLQLAACVAGMGLAGLPCFLADQVLERRTEPRPSRDLWVLVHPDLRRSPRLRIFRDEMVAALQRLQPRLEGRTGSD